MSVDTRRLKESPYHVGTTANFAPAITLAADVAPTYTNTKVYRQVGQNMTDVTSEIIATDNGSASGDVLQLPFLTGFAKGVYRVVCQFVTGGNTDSVYIDIFVDY